jgi:hypothetical protein
MLPCRSSRRVVSSQSLDPAPFVLSVQVQGPVLEGSQNR